MKKAMNAWSVDPSADFEKLFSDLSEAGFEGVEITFDKAGRSAHSLTMDTADEELHKIRLLAEKHHMPIYSVACSFFSGTMGAEDPNTRAFAQDALRKLIHMAKVLGAEGVLAVPGGSSPAVSLAEDFRRSVETVSALRREIAKSGIYVGLENVWNGFFTSPYDMIRFIDQVNCPYVDAYLDVGNMIAFSWAEFWAEALAGRIHHVHIKDFKRSGGLNSGGQFVDLLKGDVNWKAVIPALKKAGYDGYLAAEVSRSDPDMTYQEFYREVSDAIGTIISMG